MGPEEQRRFHIRSALSGRDVHEHPPPPTLGHFIFTQLYCMFIHRMFYYKLNTRKQQRLFSDLSAADAPHKGMRSEPCSTRTASIASRVATPSPSVRPGRDGGRPAGTAMTRTHTKLNCLPQTLPHVPSAPLLLSSVTNYPSRVFFVIDPLTVARPRLHPKRASELYPPIF